MLFGKKLVIVTHATERQIEETVTDAVKKAKRPSVLRFALPEGCRAENIPSGVSVLRYQKRNMFSSIREQLRDESCFLLIAGANSFCEGWDSILMNEFWMSGTGKKLITASFWTNNQRFSRRRGAAKPEYAEEKTGVYYIEPCMPALMPAEDPHSFLFTCGTPLLHYKKCLKTMLLNPGFCFGETDFLKNPQLNEGNMGYEAFANNYTILALTRSPLTKHEQTEDILLSGTSGTTLCEIYQKEIQADFDTGILAAAARTGVYPSIENEPVQADIGLKLRSRFALWKMNLLEEFQPLCVTAVMDEIAGEKNSRRLATHVRYLDCLRELPLVIYTQGSMESNLKSHSSRTKAYPGLALRNLRRDGMSSAECYGYSKLLLLFFACEFRSEFTHVCWIEADTLPHPVYEESIPNFLPYLDDKIHMAVVDGVLDATMFLLPKSVLEYLKDDAYYYARQEEETARDYSQERLWQHLYHAHPEQFCLHPMPKTGLLFLSLLERNQITLRNRIDLPLTQQKTGQPSAIAEKKNEIMRKISEKCRQWKLRH